MMSISDPGWSRPNWAGSWYFITICPNLLSFSCLISLSFAHLLSFACLTPPSFAHFIGLSCSLFYIVSFIIVIYVPWSYQYNIDTQHLSSIITITRLPVAVSLLIMACWSWIQAFWRNAIVALREHNSLGFFCDGARWKTDSFDKVTNYANALKNPVEQSKNWQLAYDWISLK